MVAAAVPGDPAEAAMKKARTEGAAVGALDAVEQAQGVSIIDISSFLKAEATEGERDAVASQVKQACEQVGFFVITGHGVDEALPSACAAAAREFFARPEEEKAQVAAKGRAYGFFPLASEALGYNADVSRRPDLREAFSMGPIDPLPPEGSQDRPGGPQDVVEFCYQATPWPPDGDTSLREAMCSYYVAAGVLADQILRIFARALNVDEGELLPKTRSHASSLRVIHYPALKEQPLPGQLRCGAHSDICTLTLLWQDVHGGLEVLPRGRTEWMEVHCPPGGLIVNLGDLMARWTNDRWVSTPHRVSCPEVAFRSSRISIPYFQILRSDAEVRCLPSCLDPGEVPRHPPTTQGEDLKRHFKRWGRNRA